MELFRHNSGRYAVSSVLDELQTGIHQRIDELFAQNDRLARRIVTLEHLCLAGGGLRATNDLQTFLNSAVQLTHEITGAAGVAVTAAEDLDAAGLTLQAWAGIEPDEPDDLHFNANDPVYTALAKIEQPIKISDLVGKAGPRSKKRAILRRLGCHLVLPLRGRKRFLGLIFLTKRPAGDAYSADDLRLFAACAALIALAMENLLLQQAND